MLLDQSNMTRHHVDDYMSENHIVPRQVLEVTTMDLLIEFVKIGLGVACVIKELVQKELDNGTLVELPLEIPIHRRTIGFAYHPANQAMSLKTFLEFLYHPEDFQNLHLFHVSTFIPLLSVTKPSLLKMLLLQITEYDLPPHTDERFPKVHPLAIHPTIHSGKVLFPL